MPARRSRGSRWRSPPTRIWPTGRRRRQPPAALLRGQACPEANSSGKRPTRGFVFQCTDAEALDAALLAGPVSAYIGFDCTAESLHVGNLVQVMILRLLQKHGHRPVVLMGGGTTRIGDPSGKDTARQLLSDEQIAANMAGIRRCFDPFMRFGGGPTMTPILASTTPTGSTRSAISRCCGTSGCISRSIACSPSTRSAFVWSASSR